jgi:TPR repeat protein
MYRDGKGAEQDINKAGELFHEAMKLGSADAFGCLLPLAYQLTEGYDIRGLRTVYNFYEDQKKKRIQMPLPLLEKFYRHSMITASGLWPRLRDDNSAEEAGMFLEAARLGIESAYFAAANCFYYGHGGMEIDKGQALKWYKLSQTYDASSYIADIYNTEGPWQDKDQALYWYEKNGSGHSYLRMAGIYEEEGKHHDLRKAFEYYSKAAEKEKTYQGHLGLCYYYGKGTDQNMELAAKCFRKTESNIMFRTSFGLIDYVEEDHPYYQFFKEYKLIAYELGLMYQNGIEVDRLDHFAFRAFQAAAYKTDNAAALFECAKYVMRDNIKYAEGKNKVAYSRFTLDENGFPSCGKGHFTGEEMLLTSAESGYLPAINHILQLYEEGKLKLTKEKAAELKERERDMEKVPV